jgi:hypothetical protein
VKLFVSSFFLLFFTSVFRVTMKFFQTSPFTLHTLRSRRERTGLGSSRFARRYLGNRLFFLFLWVLRCFSSPGSLYPDYVFIWEYWPITASGFPHSDIPGSKPAFGSPRLFVDRYVLHRLLTPRHSPCALCSLTFIIYSDIRWGRFGNLV